MQKIIEDLAEDKLLVAMDTNLIGFRSTYGRSNGCTLQLTKEVIWFYTGISVAAFNGVLFAQLHPKKIKATVDGLQAKIQKQGAPALWWIGPQSSPAQLGPLLEQLGLQPVGEVRGMAIELAKLENTPQLLAGFTLHKVTTKPMQALWAKIAAVGLGFSDIARAALARLEATLSDPQYKAQPRYLGFLDGVPVATSALAFEGE